MRAVLWSLITRRLRAQFYSDVEGYGGDDDGATRQVSAGYVCLCVAIGWTLSFVLVLFFNPTHFEAHILAIANVAIGSAGFLQIRRRGDARNILAWLVICGIATVGLLSLRHAGILPPILFTTPLIACVVALFLRGTMRASAILASIGVVGLVILTSSGVIGTPTTYTEAHRTVMTFTSLILSALCLGGVAWFSNLSRDYVMEKLLAANAAMAESAARSRVALEAAKVGLWDVPDAAERRFHVSDSFQSITGYTGEEFNRIFDALHDFVHSEDIVALREAFAMGRNRMSRLRTDFRLKTKSRGYRWFSARARYSQNPDGTTRISGSLQDINFIKAAEDALRAGRDRAREANKAKSDFIAVMSHEVRTPLNAILGSVEVLKRGDRDAETQELANLIDDAGRGLLGLVNDLLDVSKIEAGKVEVVMAPADLTALVTRTADFWRTQAREKGLDLKIDCRARAEGMFMSDAGRVRQVISNLLSNAIKFTDAGSVSITLDLKPGGGDGSGMAVIEVADTGSGVPEHVREQIFSPFEQGDAASGRGGTGLGLFISRRLARLMGGELEIDRGVRKGALFRFTFSAAPHAGGEADDEHDASDPGWTGRKVLCVDDNETNRRIVQLLLSKFGVEVVACSSGADAIATCAREPFDVILMDIIMPELDGPATLASLRRDATSLNAATPVIALTAKLSPEDMTRYAETGFDGVAGKPLNVGELAAAMAPFMIRPLPVS